MALPGAYFLWLSMVLLSHYSVGVRSYDTIEINYKPQVRKGLKISDNSNNSYCEPDLCSGTVQECGEGITIL